MKLFRSFLLLLMLLPTMAVSQKIDHQASFRNLKSDSYFRFHYENDYFAATDENYTQGYSFELVLPVFKENPVNHLFYIPKDTDVKYGLAIEHIGYTPNHYERPEIQVGDRPFASAIMLKSFVIATDTLQKSRLTSFLHLGLLGPGAFGEEMQVGIHELTGNKEPLGWRHQIKNDVVLNYGVGYEQQLFRYRNVFSLQAEGSAQLGTLFTNIEAGMNATVGWINSPFTANNNRQGFELYLFLQPMARAIGYDATLQGGVFNRESPYTIASADVERLVGQFNYGAVLKTKTLYLEFSRSLITREVATLGSAAWGGIKIGFTF